MALRVSPTVVVIGMGQLGQLFAGAFSRLGWRVLPVGRGEIFTEQGRDAVQLVLVTVGEDSLRDVLGMVPDRYLGQVVLFQNELRPDAWEFRYGEAAPSVCVVWFERKRFMAPQAVLPSVLYGSQSHHIATALEHLDLPHRSVAERTELAHQLALKNLYILGLNFSGLDGAQRALDLLAPPPAWERLRAELIALEKASLVQGQSRQGGPPVALDAARLRSNLNEALSADPDHACAGRSASKRLARTLSHAKRLGLDLPECRRIAQNHGVVC